MKTNTSNNPFHEFTWRYVNVITQALTELERSIDYEMIRKYGQDIESLVRDYMTLLASRHNPKRYQHEVDRIADAFLDPDNKQYEITNALNNRDRQVVALWRYCKDNELLDSIASHLSRIYEHDRGYYDRLVSSLLPLMDRLITSKTPEFLSPEHTTQH